MTDTSSRHSLAILVDNEPGVLARVVGLFSGRGYNIESLTVDTVDQASGLSRITLVTTGTAPIVAQIKAQLGRLIPVRQVVNLTEQGRYLESFTAFIKLVAPLPRHQAAEQLALRSGARVADLTGQAIIFELTADRETIDQLIGQLSPFGTTEVARSGSIAIGCGEQILKLQREPDAA